MMMHSHGRRNPLDRFKTVLTGASRAIAHEPEVEVAWTADAPVANGKNLARADAGPQPAARAGDGSARVCR